MTLSNPYFKKNSTLESTLLKGLVTESIKVQGYDFYYLPRLIQREDLVFGEDVLSKFGYAVSIEMYLEKTNGWGPEENLLSKFGLQMQNQVVLVMSRDSWETSILTYTDKATMTTGGIRPQEGDLVYEPFSKSLFEIKYVTPTNSDFFQFSEKYQYRLTCELFHYASEEFATGVQAIDVFNINSFNILNNQILFENGDKFIIEEECDSTLIMDGNEDLPFTLTNGDISTNYERNYGVDFTPEANSAKFNSLNPFGDL